MSTIELTEEKRGSVEPYEAVPSKILAINTRYLSNKTIKIGSHTLYLSEHDPFLTWNGTLCRKCGSNIYNHIEMRIVRVEVVAKSQDIPKDALLCPSDWIIVDDMDNLTIMSEKAFIGAYKPV